MSADTPLSAAELARWDATLATAEECDNAAGITNPGTAAARAAHTAAANGRRS